MTLKDQMAADLATFINTDEFGDSASFQCQDGGAAFPISVVVGDPAPATSMMDAGQESRRTAQIFMRHSVMIAGILAATTRSRDARRGDSLTIASGTNAGIWTIEGPSATDVGDGCWVNAVFAALDAPGGKTVREIR